MVLKYILRFFLGIFSLCCLPEMIATELVKSLPIQVRIDKDRKRIPITRLEDRIEKQRLNRWLTEKDAVLIKTDKIVQDSPVSSGFWQQISDFGESVYRKLPVWMQKWIKEIKPTPQEKKYIQQFTDKELQGFSSDFSHAKKIVDSRQAQESEHKRFQLEKAKEDMRRYFRQPRLQDKDGFEDLEAIKKTVDTLKVIYQPGTLDYEAFHAVVKEMGLE